MAHTLRARDADQLAAFARAARPVAAKAVQLTAGGCADGHADRLVEHWRREAVVLTGLTGLGGRLAAAAQDAVSAAVQGSLVVCLCEVAGVHDLRERTRVLAAAVLDCTLKPDWAPTGSEGQPEESDGDEDDEGRLRQLIEMGRRLWALRRVTKNRQEGRAWHRAAAMVPVVGAAGLLLGERHALKGVAARASTELGLVGLTGA